MRKPFRDTDLFNLDQQIHPRPNRAAYDTIYWGVLLGMLILIGVSLAWRG